MESIEFNVKRDFNLVRFLILAKPDIAIRVTGDDTVESLLNNYAKRCSTKDAFFNAVKDGVTRGILMKGSTLQAFNYETDFILDKVIKS